MRQTVKLYGLTFFSTTILALPLIVLLQENLIEEPVNLMNYSLALLAYTSWLFSIVLMSRWSFLNTLVNKIEPGATLKMHRMLGPFSIILGLIHYIMSFSMHEEIVYTGLGGGIVILVGLGTMWQLKPSLTRRWLHRGVILGVILIWAHVHFITRISILTPFMMCFDAYTLMDLSLYGWHKV